MIGLRKACHGLGQIQHKTYVDKHWSPAASGADTELALSCEAVFECGVNILRAHLLKPNSFRERVWRRQTSSSTAIFRTRKNYNVNQAFFEKSKMLIQLL